jgi:hypothetical protein
MLFRMLAVAEAFLVHSQGHPRRKLLAVSSIMLAIVCASAMAWHVTGPTAVLSAIQARNAATVGLFCFLLVYVMLRWSMGEWRQGLASRHVLFMLAMQTALAIPVLLLIAAPPHWFWYIDPIFYAVKSILLLSWSMLAIPGPPHVHSALPAQALNGQYRA